MLVLNEFGSCEIGFFLIHFTLHSQAIILINCITILKNILGCQVRRENRTNWRSITCKPVFWHYWDEVELSAELVTKLEPDVSSYFNVNGLAKLTEPRKSEVTNSSCCPEGVSVFHMIVMLLSQICELQR